MKNIGFMAVSGLVSAIVAAFLSGAPGMQYWIVFVGTVAANNRKRRRYSRP